MAEEKDNRAILYKLLVDRHFRALRHLILMIVLLFIALNYAIPYDNFEVCATPLFIYYTAGIFLSYLLPSYFNFYFLMPRYLLRKRYLTYFLLLGLLILLILIFQFNLEGKMYAALEIDPHPTYNFTNNYILFLDILGNYFLNFIAFTGCSVTLLLRYWITDNLRAKQKEYMPDNIYKMKSKRLLLLIKNLDKAIEEIETEIEEIIANDEQLSHQVKLMLSIEGIGRKTALFCCNQR